MTIKILIFALCLIYIYVAVIITIQINKNTKREDEIIEQLIMELVWSQQRQESIEALEQEPKRGKWVDRASELDADFRRHDFVCSECAHTANYFVGGSEDWWDMEKPKCCPNCGARMESDTE